MLHKAFKTFLASAATVAVIATSMTAMAADKYDPNRLRIPQMSDAPSLDPGIAEDSASIEVVEQLFLGLTDYDPTTFEVLPELATSWESSNEGKTFVFKMRKDVKWTNGKPVTAHDIVWAIRRNILPETASPYSYVLYVIKNAEDINKGKIKDATKIGVKALDDYTVQFDLNVPAGYFPAMAGLWTYRALPKDTVEKYGTKWTEPENIVSNGSYILDTWKRNDVIIMKKNPSYFDAHKVSIKQIDLMVVPDSSTGLAMYENNEVDILGGSYLSLPSTEIPRIKADPVLGKEYSIQADLLTYYLGFNNERYPTNNKLVRRAISAAIDRQLIIDRVTKGNQEPAGTFVRPPIFGSVDPSEGVGIRFDPEQARKWLAEAGFPNGKGFPQITYMHNTSENHGKIAQAVQALLKRHLNINVKIENQEWKVYLKSTMQPDAPHMFRFGWGADYPDANNFLHEVFHPTKSVNRIRWNNKEYADLVDAAQASPDQTARKLMYRRAEQILNYDEAAIAPIYFYTAQYLVKPWVKNWQHMSLGGQHIRDWSLVQP